MQIDVQPADAAAAATAATELSRLLRQSAVRLEAACPAPGGVASWTAWASTWTSLRADLLNLAVVAEDLSTASRVAATRFRETESGVIVPDDE